MSPQRPPSLHSSNVPCAALHRAALRDKQTLRALSNAAASQRAPSPVPLCSRLTEVAAAGASLPPPRLPTHLVEAEEAQVPDHVEGADPGARGDLSSHLQADLDDLQRVGENHLGSSGLRGGGRKG